MLLGRHHEQYAYLLLIVRFDTSSQCGAETTPQSETQQGALEQLARIQLLVCYPVMPGMSICTSCYHLHCNQQKLDTCVVM